MGKEAVLKRGGDTTAPDTNFASGKEILGKKSRRRGKKGKNGWQERGKKDLQKCRLVSLILSAAEKEKILSEADLCVKRKNQVGKKI